MCVFMCGVCVISCKLVLLASWLSQHDRNGVKTDIKRILDNLFILLFHPIEIEAIGGFRSLVTSKTNL